MRSKPKYIFVAGSVMSGVGKGIAAASIGKILQARGLAVTALKIDPYVNVDAGTMNPTEHGEVFVLEDGTECDQDMGNYERFLDRSLDKNNYMTTGSIYLSVIQRERNLGYNGKCVEVVPHIPLEVIDRIEKAAHKDRAEIVITEIGGTVGEYQNILFLEAVRILKLKNPGSVLLALVSFLPAASGGGELKTKPTQYAVRSLNSAGLQPDIIIARAGAPLDRKRKEKIAFNCNIRETDIISAPDVQNIYQIPLNFEKDNLSTVLLNKLQIKARRRDLNDWRQLAHRIATTPQTVKIGLAGKYFATGSFLLSDAYISVIEAIKHAAYFWRLKPEISWLNVEEFEKTPESIEQLREYHGIIIPGGFGNRGVEGKIETARFCRENRIPCLGLCYGLQLMTVEFARNVTKLKQAHTTEVDPGSPQPVIDILPEQKQNLRVKHFGATMRLGAYPAVVQNGTIAQRAYGCTTISERHRHRYEVNPKYAPLLEKAGLIFSAFSPDRKLKEIIELPTDVHPFFLGTQFHPEFKSRPLTPHPLFKEFVKTARMRPRQ